jgi:hypothetical protein
MRIEHEQLATVRQHRRVDTADVRGRQATLSNDGHAKTASVRLMVLSMPKNMKAGIRFGTRPSPCSTRIASSLTRPPRSLVPCSDLKGLPYGSAIAVYPPFTGRITYCLPWCM